MNDMETTIIAFRLTESDAAKVRQFVDDLKQPSEDIQAAWIEFYRSWVASYGGSTVTTADIEPIFMLNPALVAMVGSDTDRGVRIKFGLLLRSRVSMVCDGYRIERIPNNTAFAQYQMVANRGEVVPGLNGERVRV